MMVDLLFPLVNYQLRPYLGLLHRYFNFFLNRLKTITMNVDFFAGVDIFWVELN